METGVVLVFFMSELIAGVFVFIYWRRHRSLFQQAQAEFARAARDRYRDGSLESYMTDVMSGKESVHRRKRYLLGYLWVFLAGVLAFLIVFSIRRFTELSVAPRTVIGILAMFPFVTLLAIGFAQEADENKILSFERASADHVLESMSEGTVEQYLRAAMKIHVHLSQPKSTVEAFNENEPI